MPLERPTLQTLIDRVRNDLIARLAEDDVLRRADAEVYSRVIAAACHSINGFIEYVAKQIIIDTAETGYLERWGTIWGVLRRAAAPADGQVTMTTAVGSVIPAGTLLKAFDGQEYATASEVTATGTSTVVNVTAVVAGAAGNRTTVQTLNLVSPVAGVQPTGTAGELSGGADAETDDSLRTRLLARIQNPPHGGAAADYVAWALEVAGVTRAWVYANELGLGTVSVRFMRDDDASPIPDSAEVADVQAYIAARKPVTAQLTVIAPVAVPLNMTIDVTPDNATVRAAIESEVRDFIRRESEPGGTLRISRLREAISVAAGESYHELTSPTADITVSTGQISTMGTITWA